MKKVIFVCGPAGIGKSTFCQSYVSTHPEENVKIVSSDEERKLITGSYLLFPPNKDMKPVYAAMVRSVKTLFESENNITILLDTTMLTDDKRKYFLNNLPAFDEYGLYLLKLHDWGLCLKRNQMRQREKWVPEEVIRSMISKYRDPKPEVASRFAFVETVYMDKTIAAK